MAFYKFCIIIVIIIKTKS